MADLLVKLYELPSRPTVAEGVAIRRARAYERHQVIPWIREHFSPGWAGEAEAGFANNPVTCLVAVEQGQVLGFACYDATCLGFFGPTGVAQAQRGRGLGKALLLAALHEMAHAGYAYAVIGGVGPTGFYEKYCGAIPIPGSTPGIYRDKIT